MGYFSNTCNELLDFQTHKYEVCMQDLTLTVGSWDNVREGGNMINIRTKYLLPTTAYVKLGRYTNLVGLVSAINNALNVEHFKFVHNTQTDEEHTRLESYMGFGGRFELTAAVAEKPGTPAIQAPDSLCIYDKAGNCIPVITQELDLQHLQSRHT